MPALPGLTVVFPKCSALVPSGRCGMAKTLWRDVRELGMHYVTQGRFPVRVFQALVSLALMPKEGANADVSES